LPDFCLRVFYVRWAICSSPSKDDFGLITRFLILEFKVSMTLLRFIIFSNPITFKILFGVSWALCSSTIKEYTYIIKAFTLTVPYNPYHTALDIMIKLHKVSHLLDRSHNYFDFHRTFYTKICEFLDSFNWLKTWAVFFILFRSFNPIEVYFLT